MPKLHEHLVLARKTFAVILALFAIAVPLATIALISGPDAPLWMHASAFVVLAALTVSLLIHSHLLRRMDVESKEAHDQSEGS